VFFAIAFSCTSLFSQTQDSLHYKTVAANKKLNKPKLYQWLWGHNRRIEWATPVTVPVLWLDSAGLKPYDIGGGNETKTLHLKSADGKLYSLRSINKSRKDVILPIYKNTFIEGIIKDGVSMSYPYGAFGVSKMEAQSGIYHTKPKLVYVPVQPALDTFNKKFGDNLYLLEEKLDGDWSNENNLGNFTDFISADKMVEEILKDNKNKADEYNYLKARLFDILIADWDRHEDNWEWARKDTLSFLYEAVPKDRDQAFFTHDGFLINKVLPAEGLGFMQNFGDKPGDMKTFNTEEKHYDRFFLNALSYNDWMRAASELQNELTDSVIYNSIKDLPPEIFKISGEEIIQTLKSRRSYIPAYTKQYYYFLSKQVDVIGSEKSEYFSIQTSGDSTNVSVYRLNDGIKEIQPFYNRTFYPAETKIIYVYGIDGNDVFKIDGDNTIPTKIIGGFDKDSIIQNGAGKVFIYDDKQNFFTTNTAKLRLSNDSDVHEFKYDWYRYNKDKLVPSVFYSNEDRLYAGLGYSLKTYKWRKDSFVTKQLLDVHYSISQNAISATYTAAFPNIIGNWSLNVLANYDAVRWTNFFGLGNDSKFTTTDKNYFRMRSREWFVSAGLQKQFGKSTFTVSPFFQSVSVLEDTDRFVSKMYAPVRNNVFQTNNYTGIDLKYSFVLVNDSVVPTKGITFLADAAFKNNFMEKDFYQNYMARVQTYLPIVSKFSLAIRAGVATVGADNEDILNSAQFYEHATIGGPDNLRGYKRERFWGKTSFYNENELRFITNLHTHLMNAKFGMLAFFDDGRVWLPGETSNTLHTSFGGGILLAPFNAVSATVTYGISKEVKLIQIRINKLL
jgi:hypothetical protein